MDNTTTIVIILLVLSDIILSMIIVFQVKVMQTLKRDIQLKNAMINELLDQHRKGGEVMKSATEEIQRTRDIQLCPYYFC